MNWLPLSSLSEATRWEDGALDRPHPGRAGADGFCTKHSGATCASISRLGLGWEYFASARFDECLPTLSLSLSAQVTKYVEREIVNHRTLMHPHIVQFKEVGGGWEEGRRAMGP